MNTTCVTVLFAASDVAQSTLSEQLMSAVFLLKTQGVVSSFAVEAVFPYEEDATFKGLFIVKFESVAPKAVLAALKALPGVKSAYVPPGRETLASDL